MSKTNSNEISPTPASRANDPTQTPTQVLPPPGDPIPSTDSKTKQNVPPVDLDPPVEEDER